jgi:cell division cycle protein 37
MPLNYSKWDQLELSDDSDIEGHPNVDHKSLVRCADPSFPPKRPANARVRRWKQRDIHEKRQVRNMTIAQLEADIACNSVLRPRIAALLAELQQADDAPALFSRTVARLRAEPAPDAPAPGAQTYDAMIYALLLRVYEDVKGKGIEGQDPRMGDALQDALKTHLGQLDADIADKKAKIEEEKSEKSKKITSEDIHEGFESKVRSVLHKTQPRVY